MLYRLRHVVEEIPRSMLYAMVLEQLRHLQNNAHAFRLPML
jgi:hypothetical protein